MFTLATEPTFKTTVSFRMPNDKGSHDNCSFQAHFKMLKVSEIEAMRADGDDRNIIKEVLIGFSGVKDENKEEVPFSPVAVDAMLDIPIVAKAIADTYFREAVAGGAKAKN